MTDPRTSPDATAEPGAPPDARPVPGERRLARPPSDRYRESEARAGETGRPRAVGPWRGAALGGLAALGGAVVIVVLGGLLAVTGGLLIVAAVLGRTVAAAVGFGAGASLRPSRRAWLAAAIALGGVIVGQIGLWLNATNEGGVLSPLDYLGEVYGPLVPVQVLIAPIVAWVSAR